jgi:hypothetical protein
MIKPKDNTVLGNTKRLMGAYLRTPLKPHSEMKFGKK